MFDAPKRELPNIGLTALIDVVFILLIFVVLAANFDRIRGLNVELPEAGASALPKTKALVLSITKKGAFFLGKQEIASQKLFSVLQKRRKKHSALLLRADGEAALRHAVKAMDIAASLRFKSVSIATKPSFK